MGWGLDKPVRWQPPDLCGYVYQLLGLLLRFCCGNMDPSFIFCVSFKSRV